MNFHAFALDVEAASCRFLFSGQSGRTPLLRSPFEPAVRRAARAAGFSLIEVVIALGIISFALVAVIGLLPTGLNSQRQAVNQAFGVQALNDVAQAVMGMYTTNGSNRFGAPLAGVSGMTVSQGALVSNSLPLYEDGSLTNSAVTRRGTVVIVQKALVGSARPVFISVTWPQTNAQGSASAFLYLPQ